jgi:hypothetical protein
MMRSTPCCGQVKSQIKNFETDRFISEKSKPKALIHVELASCWLQNTPTVPARAVLHHVQCNERQTYIMHTTGQEGAVCIATRQRLDDREVRVRVPVGSRIFSSPRRPDRLWGSPNHLSSGYRGLFPRG